MVGIYIKNLLLKWLKAELQVNTQINIKNAFTSQWIYAPINTVIGQRAGSHYSRELSFSARAARKQWFCSVLRHSHIHTTYSGGE